MKLNDSIRQFVLEATSSKEVTRVDKVQTLWSGYGHIFRMGLLGGSVESVIMKHVTPPSEIAHPRGWTGDRSHARKLRSYEVEANWYANFSANCHKGCRVPRCWSTRQQAGEFLLVLEDLDASGYSERHSRLNHDSVLLGLDWLAQFHAQFIGVAPDGLWEVGTYWHLATRPDEWNVMPSGSLKAAAKAIDSRLNQCQYQTLVHGDAKVANFCFAADATTIAAVDFQYVGGGCGMKDVAYFLGSCLDESDLERSANRFLDYYFAQFRKAHAQHVGTSSVDKIEAEWRWLYPFAWADFTRFMLGWCPGHSKLNRYSRQISEQVTQQLAKDEAARRNQ